MNKPNGFTRYLSGLLIATTVVLLSVAAPALEPTALAYVPETSPSWTLTGHLNAGRFAHSATLLPGGKVLVAGGLEEEYSTIGDIRYPGGFTTRATAELYDPATGTWSYTGSLNTARCNHTATLLRNGQVLIAGGGGKFQWKWN